jgi:hypothetical protein
LSTQEDTMTHLSTSLVLMILIWDYYSVKATGKAAGNFFFRLGTPLKVVRQVNFPKDTKREEETLPDSLKVRGGDLGPVSGKALAKVLCGLGAADAMVGALAPRTSMKWMSVDIEDSNHLAYYYLHGIGASAATMAISLYLAVSGVTSKEEAIGFGFLARLLSMTVLVVTHQSKELGMNSTLFVLVWVAMAVTTFALFTGNWEMLTLVKFVSLLLGVHGFFLYGNPTAFVQKAMGKSKAEAQKGTSLDALLCWSVLEQLSCKVDVGANGTF